MKKQFIENDKDLCPILEQATDEELDALVGVLRHGTSCQLTDDCRNTLAIADELQRMGGNSIANVTRDHGVTYDEIVNDVAKVIKADTDPHQPIGDKEWAITKTLIELAEKNLDPKDQQKLKAELEALSKKRGDAWSLQRLLGELGNSASSRTRALARLALGVKPDKQMGYSPILVGLSGILASASVISSLIVAGAAQEVTIPAVLVVAGIRSRLKAEEFAEQISGSHISSVTEDTSVD